MGADLLWEPAFYNAAIRPDHSRLLTRGIDIFHLLSPLCYLHIHQGHRIAKNVNNSFAILDAISEEINNLIFRKAHRVVGLSSALIGSGMAFDYKIFKKEMKDIKAIGGFDKELEMNFLQKKSYYIIY